MDARKLIQDIPVETLISMVGILTNGTANPQFVRAAAMDIKRSIYQCARRIDDIECRIPG